MQFKEYLLKYYTRLLEAKKSIKEYLLKNLTIFCKFLESTQYQLITKQYLLKYNIILLLIKKFLLKKIIVLLIFLQHKKQYCNKYFLRLKKYLLQYYNKLLIVKQTIKENIINNCVTALEIIQYLFNKHLLKLKKYLLRYYAVCLEIKEKLLQKLLFLITTRKYLLKVFVFLLGILLINVILYVSKAFKFQSSVEQSVTKMQNELTNTLLPLTNLLSKAAGSIDIMEYIDESSIKPIVHYDVHDSTHKIELIFLNPTYNLIDCSGELLSNAFYPIKINLIWQIMDNSTDRYELICERYSNYNTNNNFIDNTKYVYKTVLLRNINKIKIRFLEQLPSGNIRIIAPQILQTFSQKLNHVNIVAIQIGMLTQSAEIMYPKIRHSWYNIFNERVNFLDDTSHKVIYMTINSNLT